MIELNEILCSFFLVLQSASVSVAPPAKNVGNFSVITDTAVTVVPVAAFAGEFKEVVVLPYSDLAADTEQIDGVAKAINIS